MNTTATYEMAIAIVGQRIERDEDGCIDMEPFQNLWRPLTDREVSSLIHIFAPEGHENRHDVVLKLAEWGSSIFHFGIADRGYIYCAMRRVDIESWSGVDSDIDS